MSETPELQLAKPICGFEFKGFVCISPPHGPEQGHYFTKEF